MSKILNLKGVKFLAIIVLAVAILATFGLAAVQTASADCTVVPTLRVGSSGANVMCVQAIVGATADGAFGPLTKASVMAWQAGHNLVADGVVGPLTAAAMNSMAVGVTYPIGCTSAAGFSIVTGNACTAIPSGLPSGCTSTAGFSPTTGVRCDSGSTLPAGCTSTAGYSPTTGVKCDSSGSPVSPSAPLAGLAGTIDDVTRLSQYSGEEVGDGQNDVKVMGFKVEASNDGDIRLDSTKLRFVITNGSGSTRLEDYVDSVSVWQGSTRVGSADAMDFTRVSAGVYTKVVTLSNSVVRANQTEEFFVTVDGQNNLDSGDIDSETVVLSTDNIRYTDGGGVTTTDTTTGDIDAAGVTIAFVSFSTSADTELKIALNNTPDASVVDVDATNNTDDVVLLKGKFTVDGSSDVWMDTLPITLVTTHSGDGSITAITGSVTLKLGNNTYTESTGTNCLNTANFTATLTCSASANTTAGVLFDNLDYTIAAGSTVNFTITADINDIDNTGVDGTDFDEGDTLSASLTAAARALAAFVVENEQGDALAAGEKTGTALGEVQTFRDTGIQATLVSTTAAVALGASGSPDLGEYTLTFDVTAFGADQYVSGMAPTEAGTSNGTTLVINGCHADCTLVAEITSPGTTRAGTLNGANSTFWVPDGTTKRFTVTAVVTPVTAGGLTSVSISELNFGPASATEAVTAYTTNLDDFVTPSKNLKLTN